MERYIDKKIDRYREEYVHILNHYLIFGIITPEFPVLMQTPVNHKINTTCEAINNNTS